MDKETITLTMREARRLLTIEAALSGRITNSEGARRLGLSERQFKRLRKRVATEGPQGAIHKGRGKASNRRIDEAERSRIKDLLVNVYAGFNDTHAHEMLVARDGATVSRQTVRAIRVEAGRAAVRRRRGPKHRSRRERRAREGAMILLDGSTHDWFEGRAPSCTLLGAIDDATGAVVGLRFEPSEDLAGYLSMFSAMLDAHGVPASTYSDGSTIFFLNNVEPTLDEQLEGIVPLTQFGRALDELGIEMIHSLSPQSRGRIERLWGTLQDRLVSELRLEGVTSMQQANPFLAGFVARFNTRFARTAIDDENEWLRPPKDHDWFLCAKYRRTVANDNTVRLGERLIDIPPGAHRISYAKARVEVHELTDGRIRVVHEGHIVAEQASPDGFARLKPRDAKGLTAAGQLPVATLTVRCKACREKAAVIQQAG